MADFESESDTGVDVRVTACCVSYELVTYAGSTLQLVYVFTGCRAASCWGRLLLQGSAGSTTIFLYAARMKRWFAASKTPENERGRATKSKGRIFVLESVQIDEICIT